VRSTVVDAFACNFRVTVPAEAVYDRTPIVHQADLFDMARKYADVRPVAEVVEVVRGGE
jgi:isochorismate hydrolase